MKRRTFRDAQRERETVSALAFAILILATLATLATIAGF